MFARASSVEVSILPDHAGETHLMKPTEDLGMLFVLPCSHGHGPAFNFHAALLQGRSANGKTWVCVWAPALVVVMGGTIPCQVQHWQHRTSGNTMQQAAVMQRVGLATSRQHLPGIANDMPAGQ